MFLLSGGSPCFFFFCPLKLDFEDYIYLMSLYKLLQSHRVIHKSQGSIAAIDNLGPLLEGVPLRVYIPRVRPPYPP